MVSRGQPSEDLSTACEYSTVEAAPWLPLYPAIAFEGSTLFLFRYSYRGRYASSSRWQSQFKPSLGCIYLQRACVYRARRLDSAMPYATMLRRPRVPRVLCDCGLEFPQGRSSATSWASIRVRWDEPDCGADVEARDASLEACQVLSAQISGSRACRYGAERAPCPSCLAECVVRLASSSITDRSGLAATVNGTHVPFSCIARPI
ncbi:hypothetical protein C8Q80DRAFT_333945 [Daedaleopsis nitida]|nr:hypothetical protein C8Q80DRAFT_333945 [Daedaleopsis nitida]